MAVKIRLNRMGAKKDPFYRVVVADSRAPRDGRFIERVGTYNPLLSADDAKRVIVKEERIKYWLSVGAQPTERVQKLLAKLGLCSAPVLNARPQKSAPKAKAVERAKAKAEAAQAAKAEA